MKPTQKLTKQQLKTMLSELNSPRPEGLKVGLKSALHQGQINALKPLFSEDKGTLLIACGRKFGKMLDLEDTILTPDRGYIRYGDLKEGDLIFDEKGNHQKVMQLHPIQISPQSYRVHFDNGTHIDACSDHQWLTYTKGNRRSLNPNSRHNSKPVVKNTKEIYDTQLAGKEYNHSIPCAKPLDLEYKDLLVDPYVLGAWLGDGSRSDGRFTSVDLEIIEEIRKNYSVTSYSDKKEWYIKSLVGELREIGVYKNKHVPYDYLMGSIEQRYALLQGLMDTDGTINKAGNNCTFDNTNKSLAEAVYHLVASLGMIPKWKERIGKLNGVEKKKCYRVYFHPRGNKVFRLTRKQNRVKEGKKLNHHTIIKVEKIESKPMRCITVSGESHLFLMGKSLIPTHNTEMAVYLLWRQALLNPGSACYYVAPTREQAKKLLWDVRRLHNYMDTKYIEGKPNNRDLMIRLKNGSFIQLMGSENYEGANGLSPHLIVYDEFKAFNPNFHRTMGPNRVTHGAKLIVIGTMADPSAVNKKEYNALMKFCKQDDSAAIHIATTFDNPINKLPHKKRAIEEEIALLRARGDEDVIQREFYSRVIPGGSKSIFPMFSRDKHVKPHDEIMKELSKDLSNLEWYCTIDPGNTTCYAAILAAINPYTKKIYLLDEMYVTQQVNTSTTKVFPEIIRKAKELYPLGYLEEDWTCTYDQAAAWAATEILSQYGVNFMPTNKSLNNKETGLSLLKDVLLHNLITISDRCENTISEIESYAKDDKGRIPKVDDHAIDATRYTLHAANYNMLSAMQAQVKDNTPDMYRGRFLNPTHDESLGNEFFGDFSNEFDWD